MALVSLKVIDAWAAKEQFHTVEANKASAQWQARKAELKQYIKDNAATFTSADQVRQKFAIDWELADAMDAWNWHRREANRFGSLIRTQKALRGIYRMETENAR